MKDANKKIRLLDCTLRDGSYVNESEFGSDGIRRILSGLSSANVDIIECGWLKDASHKTGTAYYRTPRDIEQYLPKKLGKNQEFLAMIDWNRYDLKNLDENNGKSISAIRIVFPRGKALNAAELGAVIKSNGYGFCMQAANTASYADDDLKQLADIANQAQPLSVSIVDTFGRMFPEDFGRICKILDERLNEKINLNLHTHNNLQLGFANVINFLELTSSNARSVIVDSSLSGFGRGAGNTPTELAAYYLNKRFNGDYKLEEILGIIDDVMNRYADKFQWGYNSSMFIAGMYGSHVNNIAWLEQKYKISSRGLDEVIKALTPEKRMEYDYDNLQDIYQSRIA
jgi:4-hydroxy 2-oxovalerate aldolase